MIKYQCNACGMIYSLEMDAVKCHPDINVIDDDDLPKRDAAEHYVERTEAGPTVTEDITSEKGAACKHKLMQNRVGVFCLKCGATDVIAALPD